jgi:2,4-diacetylphloroglucinol hydrolase
MNLIPVTYFPAPTQQVYADNERRIRDKPYAKLFTGQMHLRPEVVAALRQPMPLRDALRPDELSRLLDPTDAAARTGYCVLPDGTAYVASHTVFPGAIADMLAWWFWWFMVERERYAPPRQLPSRASPAIQRLKRAIRHIRTL